MACKKLPSPQAMENLHRLIARILPKYIDKLNALPEKKDVG